MTVLITGATGFLGRRVASVFARSYQGEVRCLVRQGSDIAGLKESCGESFARLKLVWGTLLSRADCEAAVRGVDLVLHLASGTAGAPAEYFLNSSAATRNLLNAMSESKPKLLHCSSFSVYGCADLPAGATIDEQTGVEKQPEKRDIYAQSKIHQEKLVLDLCSKNGIPHAVIRPGVIYGPGGSAISPRVGLKLFGKFLHLGRNTLIPLTFVDNCAEAFSVVAKNAPFDGAFYNVVDDDLLTSRSFLTLYRTNVERVKPVHLPYWMLYLVSAACEWYHSYSSGQLPDIFTKYKTRSMWKGFRYSNGKLKSLGWKPVVSTEEGLRSHFRFLSRKMI
jgi:2-alkyl-3-oxoalkanoate reductase